MRNWSATCCRAAMAALLIQPILLLADHPPARAQPGYVPPELPFTHKYGVSARAAGLGYAYGAVAEDASALYFNPAGLAQVRRIEIGSGILHDAQTRSVAFDTRTDGFSGTGISATDADISKTQLTHLNFAYPFPTYRGALVLGAGYQRLAPLTSDYIRRGLLAAPGATPGILERERFTEEGSIDLWTVGLAGDVSPSISIGGTISMADGRSTQDFRIGRLREFSNGATDVNDSDQVFDLHEVRDADISGWTWSAGLLGRVGDQARLGLTVFGPESYDFEGAIDSRLEDQEKVDQNRFRFADHIDLPLSVLTSIAITPKNLLLAADLRFTDWTQIDFEGAVESPEGEEAYRSTVDINLGAEYQFDQAPIRVRAGFSSQPLPYRLEPAGLQFTFVPDDGNPGTTDDTSYFTRAYPRSVMETDRHFVTVGVGALLEDALSLDFAYVHGIYERSGGGFSEKWTTDRVYATGSVRF